MQKLLSKDEVAGYRDRGYHFPIDALSAREVADFRGKLEEYEAESGGPIKAEMRHRSHVLLWQRLAASIALAALLGGAVDWQWQRTEERRRGEEARRQVLTALRITNHALDQVSEHLASH